MMETGLVAMVDNVLTTDRGQVSILDLSGLSAALEKAGHVVFTGSPVLLGGTAKSQSARPSLLGEAPARPVACGWSALRTWLVLASFGPLCWLKCVDGISEVSMSTGVAALRSAFYFTVQVTVAPFLYHRVTQPGLQPRPST